MADSTVAINSSGSTGAGTVIAHVGNNTYIVTCEHVIRGAKKVEILSRLGGRFIKTKATVERFDEENDLALVRTSKRLENPIQELSQCEPELYSRIYGVGNAGGMFGTGFEGVLTSTHKMPGNHHGYAYVGLSCPGMSGGAFADGYGGLCGVIQSMDTSGHLPVWTIGYAIPLPILKKFLGDVGVRKVEKKRTVKKR